MTKIIKGGLLSLGALIILILVGLMTWDQDYWNDFDVVERDDYEIIRDDFGVPLVVGQSDEAVAYGVAMAHAADDFETLQMMHLGVRRRYGSVAGADGAKVDFFSHLLLAREQAAKYYMEQLEPKTRAYIESYADGINAFARKHPERVLRKDIYPLTGEDIAAGFVMTSPLFFGLDDVVGNLVEGKDPPGKPRPLMKKGSNAFAIAPHRSSDGMTRLVSNSHQPWEGPVAWYELRVESAEGWRFYGTTFPGAPFPLMGHNDNLGWTNTVNRPDLLDVYKLVLSKDKKSYKFGDDWLPLKKRHIWLKVKAGPFTLPIRQTLYRSVHGPVLFQKNGAYAVRYPGMKDIRQVEQYYKILKTRNWHEWRDVMSMQSIHGTNFIYADKEGNTALLYNASLPLRDPAYDWWEVLPGDDPGAVWTRLVPSEDIPQLLNPKAGYIINANNTPFLSTAAEDNLNPEDYRHVIGIEPYTTNRIIQALSLFAAEDQTSPESLNRIKYNEGYNPDSTITKLMQASMAVPAEGSLAEAVTLLNQWDYVQDGVGPADSLAAVMLLKLRLPGYQVAPPPDPAAILQESADYLMTHFGRLDVPLSDLLRIRHGDKDMPITGGPDALRAMMWTEQKDGTLTANFGDSFIMFVTWDKNGVVESKSIQPFGSNVQDEESPHYTDQLPLFANKQLKDTGFVTRVPIYKRGE